MPKLRLGSTEIKKFRIGSTIVKNVYAGLTKVWSNIDRGSYLLTANTVLPNSSTARTNLPLSVNSGAGYDSFPVLASGNEIFLPAGNYTLSMGWQSPGFRTDWKAAGILRPTGEVVAVPTPNVGSSGPMTWSLPFTMTAEGNVSIIASVASSNATNRTVSAASFTATIIPA